MKTSSYLTGNTMILYHKYKLVSAVWRNDKL